MMTEYPIDLEWTIAESRLNAIKNSKENECLTTEYFIVSHAFGIKYCLSIHPNGCTTDTRRRTLIYLYVFLGDVVKKVEADVTLSIKAHNWNGKLCCTFEDGKFGHGVYCCSVNELF